jgi:hypothetical protein
MMCKCSPHAEKTLDYIMFRQFLWFGFWFFFVFVFIFHTLTNILRGEFSCTKQSIDRCRAPITTIKKTCTLRVLDRKGSSCSRIFKKCTIACYVSSLGGILGLSNKWRWGVLCFGKKKSKRKRKQCVHASQTLDYFSSSHVLVNI